MINLALSTAELMPILGVVVAAFGAVLGYTFRGQIRGTTADKLWDVTEKLRQEQAQELRALRLENKEHAKRLAELEKEASINRTLAEQLKRENQWKDDLIARLQLENQTLLQEVTRLRKG